MKYDKKSGKWRDDKGRFIKASLAPDILALIADATEAQIRDMLDKARSGLTSTKETANLEIKRPLDVLTRIHVNRDKSIDSELTIIVPRGMSPRRMIVALERYTSKIPDTWVSVGVRVPPRPEETVSGLFVDLKSHKPKKRGKGAYQAGTYYQHSDSQKYNFATGRKIVSNFANAGRRKPEQVYIRIHWNPDNRKPTRED